MNSKSPLDQLSSFYDRLDAIPTPPLIVNQPRGWSFWSMMLAPLGASLFACAFMALCASGPKDSNSTSPVPLLIDRYAVDEIKSMAPTRKQPGHASNHISTRFVA